MDNKYVDDMVKVSSTFLFNDVIVKSNSSINNPKQHLSLIRHLCMYPGENLSTTNLVPALIETISGMPDQDVERKIIRTCYSIIIDIIIATRTQSLTQANASVLNDILQKETESRQSIRSCLAWRLLSIISIIINNQDNFLNKIQQIMSKLKYPEKQRKMILGQKKADREHRNQIELWTSLFSSFHRLNKPIPSSCIDNLIQASISPHLALSRHALAVILHTIQKDPNAIGQLFMTNLHNKHYDVQISDTLCCLHIIRTCQALVTAANTNMNDLLQIKNTMITFMNDKRLAISLEAIRCLSEYWGFREAMEGHSKLEVEGPNSTIGKITTCLVTHLQSSLDMGVGVSAPTSTSTSTYVSDSSNTNSNVNGIIHDRNRSIGSVFEIIPICRSCLRLGKVLIMRPRESGQLQQQEQELLFLSTPSSTTALTTTTTEDILSETLKPLGQQLAGLVAVLQAPQYVNNPHMRCEALKAMLWIIPDARDTADKHSAMWTWLQKQIIQMVHQLDIGLITSLVVEVLRRIKDTPYYSAPVVELAIAVAEAGVLCCSPPTENAIALLIYVWKTILPPPAPTTAAASHQYNTTNTRSFLAESNKDKNPLAIEPHSRFALCRSFLCLLDDDSTAILAKIGEFESVLYDIKNSTSIGGSTSTSRYNMTDSNGVPYLVAILTRLIQGLWYEGPTAKHICATSLFNICTQLSDSHIGLKQLVLHELQDVSIQFDSTYDIQAMILALTSITTVLELRANKLLKIVRIVQYSTEDCITKAKLTRCDMNVIITGMQGNLYKL
eukprot:gene9227-19139_t